MSVSARLEDGRVMEEEIWENQARKMAHGQLGAQFGEAGKRRWMPTTARPPFSDRSGERSFAPPGNVGGRDGWRELSEFVVQVGPQTDGQGWMYQSSLVALDTDFAKGWCKSEEKPRYLVRRRRWVRSLERCKATHNEADGQENDDRQQQEQQQQRQQQQRQTGSSSSERACEGWLGLKSHSKGGIGRAGWKSRYCVLWVRSASNCSTGATAWHEEPSVCSEADGSPPKGRAKLGRKALKSTYKRQKEKISHLRQHKGLVLEGNVAVDPVWMYFKESALIDHEFSRSDIGYQEDSEAAASGNNKGRKSRVRWFVLGPSCVIDDTIATAENPGYFAIHFSKKVVQVLNAFSGPARLRWIEALRETVAEANPARSAEAVVRKSPNRPRKRKNLIISTRSLSSTALPAPLVLNAKSYASKSSEDLMAADPEAGATESKERVRAQPKEVALQASSTRDAGMIAANQTPWPLRHSRSLSATSPTVTVDKRGSSGVLSFGRKLKSTFRATQAMHATHATQAGVKMPGIAQSGLDGTHGWSPSHPALRRSQSAIDEGHAMFPSPVALGPVAIPALGTRSGEAAMARTDPLTIDIPPSPTSVEGTIRETSSFASLVSLVSPSSSSPTSASPTSAMPLDKVTSQGEVLRFALQKTVHGLGFCIRKHGDSAVAITRVFEGTKCPVVEPTAVLTPCAGDVLLSLNGAMVSSVKDVMTAVEETPVGDWVKLKVRRGQGSSSLTPPLTERFGSQTTTFTPSPSKSQSSSASQLEKLEEIYQLFADEVPVLMRRAGNAVTYDDIRRHICALLGASDTMATSVEWRRWFRDQLDVFFDRNAEVYEFLGVDLACLAPAVRMRF